MNRQQVRFEEKDANGVVDDLDMPINYQRPEQQYNEALRSSEIGDEFLLAKQSN